MASHDDDNTLGDFQTGFLIVIYRIGTAGWSIFETKRVRSILSGILLTLFVIYIITIPIRIILFILHFLISLIPGLTKLAMMLLTVRQSITFWSVLSDSFWYIPVVILFFARTFGLFSNAPFDKALMNKNESFAAKLEQAPIQQTWITAITHLMHRFSLLLAASTFLFILRLIPGIRILASLFMLLYPLYKKVFKVNRHLDNLTLTVIGLAITILFSNWIAKSLVMLSELYLTSQALSREFLTPYFCKVTAEMERQDKDRYRWLLFGYGMAMTLCFALPISGLILYPVFQQCAADVLIVMLNRKQVSFETHLIQ